MRSPGKSVFGRKVPEFNFIRNSIITSSSYSNPVSSEENKDSSMKITNFPFALQKTVSPEKKFESPVSSNKIEPVSNSEEKGSNIESINSVELERRGIGVSLPPLKPSELKITQGFSELIAPMRSSIITEALPVDSNSPKQIFSIQTPCVNSRIGVDFEPYHPIIISKDIVVTDFSNRPTSPRIDSDKPKLRSIKNTPVLYENEPPMIPILIKNPFNPIEFESFLNTEKKNNESFNENDEQEYKEFTIKELNYNSKDYNENSSEKSKKEFNESGIENNRYKPNEYFFTSPENLVVTPEVDVYNRDLIADYIEMNPEASNKNFQEKSPNENEMMGVNFSIESPNYERMLTPDIKKVSRVDTSDIIYNRSFNARLPNISINNEKSFNTEKQSLNISEIRSSLNNSGIFLKQSRVHLFRKSPAKLSPELYEKNLQGKLTLEEELGYSHK